MFEDFDIATFWEDSAYARKEYVEERPSAATIASVEHALGCKLPASYVVLVQFQNGGIPKRTCHRTAERTSWAPNHIAITGIFAVGSSKPCSLLGEAGSRFWTRKWGYPDIGVYFADCPSAGHDMLCLDYRECGPEGEPSVVHVDQEWDYQITFVAPTFEAFIRGLENDDAFKDT